MSDPAHIDQEAFRKGVTDALTFAPLRRLVSEALKPSRGSSKDTAREAHTASRVMEDNGKEAKHS